MKHLPVSLLVLVGLKITYSDNALSKFSASKFKKHIEILRTEFVTKDKSSEEKILFKALVLQHSRDFQSGLVLGPVPLLEVLDDIISTLAGKDGRVDADVVNKIWTAINLKEEIGVNMEEKPRVSLEERTEENLENKTGVNPEGKTGGNLKAKSGENLEERSGFDPINLVKKTSHTIRKKVISKQEDKDEFNEKETEEKAANNMEKVGNIMENKGEKDMSIMKEKGRKSLRKWNRSNLRKARNSRLIKAGESLNEKTSLKETAVKFFNVDAGNNLKKKAGKSIREEAGNSLRKWAGNVVKRKSGKSLYTKAGNFLKDSDNSLNANAGNSLKSGNSLNDRPQERKSQNFMVRKGLSFLFKKKKTIETSKKTDVKGKERPRLSVFSPKKKIPERQKYSFRISRSVSEDSTTTLDDNLETYTTQVPLTEERKTFLLSFFDAIKIKFDEEKE